MDKNNETSETNGPEVAVGSSLIGCEVSTTDRWKESGDGGYPCLSDAMMDPVLQTTHHNELTMKWTLFCSTAHSYRRDSLLKPFPPMLLTEHGEKDFEKLLLLIKEISEIGLPATREQCESYSDEQLQLLNWVWKQEKRFRLSRLPKNDLQQPPLPQLPPLPSVVYKVEYGDAVERRFANRSAGFRTLFAYHGSRLANFYSILHHGLVNNLNKTSAFGEGTYLSTDLQVSLHWSPLSSFAGSSCSALDRQIGVVDQRRIGCVAVCEVIDDQTGVQMSDANSRTTDTRQQNTDIPDKYILVKNDSLVIVRYLLVYMDGHRSVSNTTVNTNRYGLPSAVTAVLGRRLPMVLLIGYLVLLLAVGLMNNSSLQFYWNSWRNRQHTSDSNSYQHVRSAQQTPPLLNS